MRAILISIRPEWVAKILNGEKTIEVRKTAPKCDLPIDVYIYCTEPHAGEVLSLFTADVRPYFGGRTVEFIERKRVDNPDMRWSICNGKVVAKFTLREVKPIYDRPEGTCNLNPNVPHSDLRHYYQMGLVSDKLLHGGDENTFSEEYGE